MSTLQDILDPLTAGELRFSADVRERLVSRARKLKMLPSIAMQALDIAKNPRCGINEFSGVIERDPALAADILRIANSVVFSCGKAVLNLRQAVVRIGFRQCKSLIIAASFSSMMKQMTLGEEWVREILFRHSYTTALLGLHLNRSLNVGYEGEEFVGGLIHDIGRMLLATCYPEQFESIDPMEFVEGVETLAHEQEMISTNHCEVGVWFARKNGLPEPLIDVVRLHHCPERSRSNCRFVALVAACDHMANHLQRMGEVDGYEPSTNAAVALLEQWGVSHAVSRFREIAPTVMETARRDTIEMMTI